MRLLSSGFSLAARHKRLVVVLWLVPLLPALVLGAMAASNIAPTLQRSLFSDRVLDGDWATVWFEFTSSPINALDPILNRGVFVMALTAMFFHILVSAGIVEVLLEREARFPFILGARRNILRFLRTALFHGVMTVLVFIPSLVVAKGFFKLAEAKADGRFDLYGIALALVLFIILWAPLDLAADLSRIAAVRHSDRSMVRGYFRCLGAVLRRPGLFVPLFLAFLLLPLLLHSVYFALRSPWIPSTAGAVFALLLAQQAVMFVRALFKLGFWGAKIAAFRDLDEPLWCMKREHKTTESPDTLESDEENPLPDIA